MTQYRHGSMGKFVALTMILASIVFSAGCGLRSDLDRAEARRLLLGTNLYPAEIVNPILVFERTAHPGRLAEYINQANRTTVAVATVVDTFPTPQIGFGGLPKIGSEDKNVRIVVTEKGENYVRGEEHRLGFGSELHLPIVVYTINFGEVTGIAFQDEKRTLALVEYTEIYTPSPFVHLYERSEEGKPLRSIEKRSAVFKLYDDGWRIVEDAESKALATREKRTAPPEK